jgi:hypothetical protein
MQLSNCLCDELIEIKGFGGYGHYESTLKVMDKNIINGHFRKTGEDTYEITYKCISCHQIWKLGIPDFPIVGYFHRKQN